MVAKRDPSKPLPDPSTKDEMMQVFGFRQVSAGNAIGLKNRFHCTPFCHWKVHIFMHKFSLFIPDALWFLPNRPGRCEGSDTTNVQMQGHVLLQGLLIDTRCEGAPNQMRQGKSKEECKEGGGALRRQTPWPCDGFLLVQLAWWLKKRIVVIMGMKRDNIYLNWRRKSSPHQWATDGIMNYDYRWKNFGLHTVW